MTIPEMVFLDAGILIGAVTRNDPRHQESRLIVEAARRDSSLYICGSN